MAVSTIQVMEKTSHYWTSGSGSVVLYVYIVHPLLLVALKPMFS